MPVNSMPSAKQISHTENAKVLLVDDSEDILKLISMRLKPMKFDLKTAQSAEQALSILSIWNPDLVITDQQMPGLSGMQLFKRIHTQDPLLPVIILTAHGTIPDAVKATQAGVSSFLTKPFNGDELVTEIQTVLMASGFTNEYSASGSAAIIQPHWREHILTKNAAVEAILHQLEHFADTDALLLFEGEQGSGKDELARAVHARSSRSNNKFAQIACISLPEELLNLELFGKIGDGSIEQPERPGLLREADGGTLLISDYNEASPYFIQKLMQSIVDKKAKPIDSQLHHEFDVRPIITTTVSGRYGQGNNDIWELGTQLDITSFRVPPLRERREDIPLIANHCLANLNYSQEIQFASKAMQVMLSDAWPGNVRQLINVVRQCARLCKTKVISEALVNTRLQNPEFDIQPLTNAHRDFERSYLVGVLKATNGNVTRAANMAKRNRTEFHRLLKKHQIEAKSFRQ